MGSMGILRWWSAMGLACPILRDCNSVSLYKLKVLSTAVEKMRLFSTILCLAAGATTQRNSDVPAI